MQPQSTRSIGDSIITDLKIAAKETMNALTDSYVRSMSGDYTYIPYGRGGRVSNLERVCRIIRHATNTVTKYNPANTYIDKVASYAGYNHSKPTSTMIPTLDKSIASKLELDTYNNIGE